MSSKSAEGSLAQPWCSLVTVTYNSVAALSEFWQGAASMPAGVEWIVVDNGSSDGSAEVAEELGATRVIRRNGNFGFSSSNNVGYEAARGHFVGFVNPDVRVDFSDLSDLFRLAEDRQALVSPQLLNEDGSDQPNGRGFPLLWDKIRNRLGGENRLEGRYLLRAEAGSSREVCWLMGASIFATRGVVDKIGAWDPHFFLYYEDKDICLRAWEKGVPVLLAGGTKWLHGWARETLTIRATPWKRELSSMYKFYRRYPEFLLSRSTAIRKHPAIQRSMFGLP